MKWRDFIRQAEREYWLMMLSAYPTRAEAAKAAGVHRTQMYYRLAALEIPRRTPGVGNAQWQELGQ